jgi:hypothetical protein
MAPERTISRAGRRKGGRLAHVVDRHPVGTSREILRLGTGPLGTWSLGALLVAVLAVCAVLTGLFWLLQGPQPERPFLRVLGASFIYNYRVADIYMGFTAVPDRPIPTGSLLRATFENPADPAAPFVVEERISLMDRRIALRSPSLRGVEKDRDYRLSLVLLDRVTRQPFWQYETTLRSGIAENVVPAAPLVIGPGYQRQPSGE